MNKPDNMDIRKKFGENLRSLRKSRGYSQMRFAETIGLGTTQAAVSAWELGAREPEMSVVFDIANTLKVPVSSLIPIEMSGMDEDVSRKILDVLYQNPQLFSAFDKIKYFDEKQMAVVLSVIEAISKETKES